MKSNNSNHIVEPEEITNTIDIKDPLMEEPIIDRGHTNSNSGMASNQPMPEDHVQPPPMEDFTLNDKGGPQAGPTNSFNDSIQDLPQGEKYEAGKFAAEIVCGSYSDLLKFVGKKVCRISMSKLNRMEDRGEINLDIQLRFNGNQLIPTRKAVENFNGSVEQAAEEHLGLSQEAKDKIIPIMANEFAKSNVGLGPWATIGVIAGMDFYKNNLPMYEKFFDAKNDLYEMMREMTAEYRNRGGAVHQPTPPQQQAQPETVVEPQQPVQQQQATVVSNTPDDIYAEILKERGAEGQASLTTHGEQLPVVMPGSIKKEVKKRGPYKKRKKRMVK